MAGPVKNIEKDVFAAAVTNPTERLSSLARLPAAAAIVLSAFHFWPCESSKLWQMFCPSNAAVLLWSVFLAACLVSKRWRRLAGFTLPDESVLAYAAVSTLSAAFALQAARTVSFTVKSGLMLIGGYSLFTAAIAGRRALRTTYVLAILAAMISVSYCLVIRFAFGADRFGFHHSPFKYGTYIGTLAPLGGVYLCTSARVWPKLLGSAVIGAALVSAGSVGAVAAICTAMLAAVFAVGRRSVRFCTIIVLPVAAASLILLAAGSAGAAFRDDIKLAERDGVNLKQRYIEWQAQINILEERTLMGTAAGCINDYRSNFYYRLPKLNTLHAFDQNGWLATGAETGILGLVCFCWLVGHYLRQAYLQVVAASKSSGEFLRCALANFSAISGTCAANLFSSVHYNGVFIVFVLVLSLISQTGKVFKEPVLCELRDCAKSC